MNNRRPSRLRTLIGADLGQPPNQATPDAMTLAAWLEGRLSAHDAARVEAALAGDTLLRQALTGLGETEPKDLSRVENARALAVLGVPDAPAPAPPWWQRWLAWMCQPVQATGLAGGLAVVGFALGFDFGAGAASADARLLAQVLGELTIQ